MAAVARRAQAAAAVQGEGDLERGNARAAAPPPSEPQQSAAGAAAKEGQSGQGTGPIPIAVSTGPGIVYGDGSLRGGREPGRPLGVAAKYAQAEEGVKSSGAALHPRRQQQPKQGRPPRQQRQQKKKGVHPYMVGATAGEGPRRARQWQVGWLFHELKRRLSGSSKEENELVSK